MSKIQRTTQKIFGSNAPADDIAALGSFKTGTPVYSDDVAVLQNSAYEEGYGATLVANEAPFMEEQNSVPYILSTQIAYSLQEGIPEYDAGTTYFIGSIVKSLNENNVPVLYYSLTDNNIGNALTDDTKWKKVELGGTGGLEVGDIGLALYIDETKGLRRYLNGSILPINANSQAFLNYLKAVQLTNPEYFTTETNWQAEALLNVDGCVFKFVIDETAGTIRLPKYPEYVQIFENSAPVNIAPDGNVIKFTNSEASEVMMLGRSMTVSGVANPSMVTYPATAGSGIKWSALHFGNQTGLTGTANLSGSTTKLKLRYFIQIATGVSESVDITNEYQLNNPFFFGQSIYSDIPPKNTSWLLSNGQNNLKNQYSSYYNWILENANEDVEGFKLSTAEDITDYDFVINTQNETFRLPISTKKRVLIDKKEPTAENSNWYNLYSDGWLEQGGKVDKLSGNINTQTVTLPKAYKNSNYDLKFNRYGASYVSDTNSVARNTVAASTMWYNATPTTFDFRVQSENGTTANTWQASGYTNITLEDYKLCKLYFYVDETVQNLDLMNAGAITETLATKTDKAQAAHASMPSNRYIDLTLGATNSTYTAPADGFVYFEKWALNANTYINLVSNNLVTEMMAIFASQHLKVWIPVKKGSNFEVNYNATGVTQFFRFIYAEGAKND